MFADDIVICSESWKNVDGGLDRHKWNGAIAGSRQREGGKSQVFRVKCPGPLRVEKSRMEQGGKSISCVLQ